jgi:hypothetical protein
MDNMSNLLIGAISGNYKVKDINRWVESSNGIDSKRILLLYNNHFNVEIIPYLNKHGVEVIVPEHNMYGETIEEFPTNTGTMDIQSSYELVHNMRFFHIWQILNETEYDKVLITDVRDVYFNRDPFKDIPHNMIIASSEVVKYENEEWNKRHLFVNLGGIGVDALMDKEVYNVGVFGGAAHYVKNICRDIYLMSVGKRLVADQTSFNYLIQTSYKDDVMFTDLNDNFAVHLDVISKGFVPFNIDNINNYSIVHQYDRL